MYGRKEESASRKEGRISVVPSKCLHFWCEKKIGVTKWEGTTEEDNRRAEHRGGEERKRRKEGKKGRDAGRRKESTKEETGTQPRLVGRE
jgi:hypothetical protein